MRAIYLLIALALTLDFNAQISTVWTSSTTGTLNGVAFTLTNINSCCTSNWDLSNAPFSADPLSATEECLDYQGASDWTVTFASPISGLRIYMKWWRSGNNYAFDQPFTNLSGSGYTIAGNTVVTSAWSNGILEFTNPITSLTMSSDEMCCSSMLLTFGLSSAALPIDLTEFSATPKENYHVELNWSTQTEVNNAYFEIERSQNGMDEWESLGEVAGAGNSNTPIHYYKLDEKALHGTSYYRLKQVDFDGSFSYSQIKAVQFADLEFVTAYPVPSSGNVTFGVNSSQERAVVIDIYDPIGRKVKTIRKYVNNGLNDISLNLSTLATGQYYVTINTRDYTISDHTLVLIDK